MEKELMSQILGERAKSHLWRSYIVSWILWNWKVFIILFWDEKSDLISGSYIGYIVSKHGSSWDMLVAPLLISILYLFGLPFLDHVIAKYKTWQKIRKLNMEREILDKAHPTKSEMNEVIRLKNIAEQKRKEAEEKINVTNDHYKTLSANYQKLINRHSVTMYFRERWEIDYISGGTHKVKNAYFTNDRITYHIAGMQDSIDDIQYFEYDEIRGEGVIVVLRPDGHVVRSHLIKFEKKSEDYFEGTDGPYHLKISKLKR